MHPRPCSWCAAIALVVVIGGCARPMPSRGYSTETMPDAMGCYMQMFDETRFMGKREFINGPAKYETLIDLPVRAHWNGRIRSAKIGIGARVRVWTGESFQGRSMILATDDEYPTLSGIGGPIASIEIECTGLDVNAGDFSANWHESAKPDGFVGPA